ncbi:MAG: hypothetical protein J6Y40_06770 [Bacteroidales bacterium]|nr:hypothetical protein [Bacteroidales bacterium]
MEEKKGLLSALAETLKQYEMNQADNKESLAIALEEKLEEIAKMISSLSDRVDHLSARLNSIDNKVDSIAESASGFDTVASAETGEVPEPIFETLAEDTFEEEEEEEFSYDPEEETPEEPVEEPAEQPVEEPSEEPVVEEEIKEEEAEEEVEEETEEEVTEEPEEEVVEEKQPEPDPEKKGKDWYDWEYDYPAEYVDDILGTMGINDKLEFVRELFHSDPALFNAQMTEIDTMPNFKAIVQYFRQAHPEWKEDSDTVYRLYMHIRRKFRN